MPGEAAGAAEEGEEVTVESVGFVCGVALILFAATMGLLGWFFGDDD